MRLLGMDRLLMCAGQAVDGEQVTGSFISSTRLRPISSSGFARVPAFTRPRQLDHRAIFVHVLLLAVLVGLVGHQ